MNEEIRSIRLDADVESLSFTWGGPGWLGRLAVRRGWSVSTSQLPDGGLVLGELESIGEIQ